MPPNEHAVIGTPTDKTHRMVGALSKGGKRKKVHITLGRALLVNMGVTPSMIKEDLKIPWVDSTIRRVVDHERRDPGILAAISEKYNIPVKAFHKIMTFQVDTENDRLIIPETPTQRIYTTIRPPKITPKETKKTTFLLDNKDVDQIIARIDTKFDAMFDAVDERIDQKIAQKVPQYIPQPQENKGVFSRFWGNGHKSKT